MQTIDFPKLEVQDGPGVDPGNVGRKTPHGAILKIVATNICGSDQHMVRGRTTAPAGLVLGHEITGEVIEAGPGVEFIKEGDLVSVPFDIARADRRRADGRRRRRRGRLRGARPRRGRPRRASAR